MITLLKLGGSLITDKTQRKAFRQATMTRLAAEIASAYPLLQQNGDALIIGHGSGSFGHFEAHEHQTRQGVATASEWRGFASVSIVAAELNYLVAQALHATDLPIFRLSPSAIAQARDGHIQTMHMHALQQALANSLIPLVYGDVAFDEKRGGTILSTETIFAHVASILPVNRILLVGEVDGVYDSNGNVIPHITPQNIEEVREVLDGSSGVDVTGGMVTKVNSMVELATQPPYPTVQILNGKSAGRVQSALSGDDVIGTIIQRD